MGPIPTPCKVPVCPAGYWQQPPAVLTSPGTDSVEEHWVLQARGWKVSTGQREASIPGQGRCSLPGVVGALPRCPSSVRTVAKGVGLYLIGGTCHFCSPGSIQAPRAREAHVRTYTHVRTHTHIHTLGHFETVAFVRSKNVLSRKGKEENTFQCLLWSLGSLAPVTKTPIHSGVLSSVHPTLFSMERAIPGPQAPKCCGNAIQGSEPQVTEPGRGLCATGLRVQFINSSQLAAPPHMLC
jgi:hypothetical protein